MVANAQFALPRKKTPVELGKAISSDSFMSCTVLLCTFNGAAYLDEQLRSLAAQTIPVLNVHVSDDGSTDATLQILQHWQQIWPKGAFQISEGPRQGFAENFRGLVLRASLDPYIAFSDQDDIWHPDKLECAIAALRATPSVPALYGSRSVLVDEHGQKIGRSPMFRRTPGFANALVQSFAGGNTMVLNQPGFQLMRESSRRTAFLMHDWWAYLIVSGAGGAVYYDPTPHIDYRQHASNVLGGGLSLARRPQRLGELWNGKYVRWNASNLNALDTCSDLLDDRALALIEAFRRVRTSGPISAVRQLRRSKIYRQTPKGDIALMLAALFGRL